ncbi:alpha-amylase [Sulfodiicoccus acidiphilus]|uniref:Alpha-amylase n=1 Tax=Sulfodiicoccus acidiphilus TaxID=1670455 RepID=A0A348B0Y6_9CREN|nr:glycoside hydrolase family 57 protein [Sulfodiicoccus acidiphilus]BBD71838.1 alpha-amylase [Sulfodiicoccus acidiphilus]GGU02378.1 alpha-amylase [Sulfodiicoccus acidiphilus]
MKHVAIGFEVHQPFRVRRDYFWNPRYRGDLVERFFDETRNRDIFERVKRNCYVPATKIILEEIDRAEEEGVDLKFFFSLSGTLLEQVERWGSDFLELLRELRYTKKVEFLGQTYYHSITGTWEDKTEFREQVKQHIALMKDLLDYSPSIFENTELLTDRSIAKEVEGLGFRGIVLEGKESTLKGRSPNRPYKLKGGNISLLFRNYRLSDDVAFRFSNKSWDQYPLTAEKFAGWISQSEGYYALIFVDYETFGEHHSRQTGILDFLRWLPRELERRAVETVVPSDVVNESIEEMDLDSLSSWADVRKDESGWLGNQMQRAYDELVLRSELPSKELGGEFLRTWRYFTTSDNYYYMYVGEGGPAEVHSYFNAYDSPVEAFINEFYALSRLLEEELKSLNIDREPFFFYKGNRKFNVAWNEKQVEEILHRDQSLRDHQRFVKEWLQ